MISGANLLSALEPKLVFVKERPSLANLEANLKKFSPEM